MNAIYFFLVVGALGGYCIGMLHGSRIMAKAIKDRLP